MCPKVLNTDTYITALLFSDKSALHCLACGDRSSKDPVPPVRYPEDCAHETVCQHNEVIYNQQNNLRGSKCIPIV